MVEAEDSVGAVLAAEADAAGVAAPAVHAQLASLQGGGRTEPHNDSA